MLGDFGGDLVEDLLILHDTTVLASLHDATVAPDAIPVDDPFMKTNQNATMTYGIVGAGRVAHEHVRAIIANGNRIARIFDTNPDAANSLINFVSELDEAKPGGVPVAAESLEAMLSDEQVQGVVVAVPNALHCENAVQCLKAGKHVLLEKPMAMNVLQCDDIINAMHESNRFVQLGFVCRGSAVVREARRIVQSGQLGDVYHVKASMYRQRGIPGLGGWFTNSAMSGGGVLVDIGVHLLDLVMHLTDVKGARTVSGICEQRFGWPIADYVYEEMWAGPPKLDGVCDVEDSAVGLIRLESGVSCEVNVAWASNTPTGLLPDGIVLQGDRGGLFFDIWGDHLRLTVQQDGKVVESNVVINAEGIWDNAWRWQHEQFANAVHKNVTPVASAYNGRAVQQILDAWKASSKAGHEIAIDNNGGVIPN